MSATTTAPTAPPTNNLDESITVTTPSGTKYTLLPRDSGIFLHGWRIERHKGPISNSAELDQFQSASSIHCPEMSFLSNHLTMTHTPTGTCIKFEPKEALKACSHDPTAVKPAEKPTAATTHPGKPTSAHAAHPTSSSAVPAGVHPGVAAAASSSGPPARLQVAAASKWNTKSYDGLVEGGVKQVDHGFDWTYTTKYKGELRILPKSASAGASAASVPAASAGASSLVEPTEDEIPIAMLQRPDPILWYDSLPLFEDELHDNGVASLTIKIRVMESCLLVLLQFWLRVDNVLVRVYDTRLFHAFDSPFLIREQTCKEDTFDELAKRGMPRTASLYTDPNVVARKLTLQSTQREKIKLAMTSA